MKSLPEELQATVSEELLLRDREKVHLSRGRCDLCDLSLCSQPSPGPAVQDAGH